MPAAFTGHDPAAFQVHGIDVAVLHPLTESMTGFSPATWSSVASVRASCRRPPDPLSVMPLLAYGTDGAVHHAWAMSPTAWEDLKASYRDQGLTVPCCGAAVVPVRSPTGCKFFRHKPNLGCGVRESLAHVVCKSIMARAAARLGLDVTTEAACH